MKDSSRDRLFKFLALGDSKIGKTSILKDISFNFLKIIIWSNRYGRKNKKIIRK